MVTGGFTEERVAEQGLRGRLQCLRHRCRRCREGCFGQRERECKADMKSHSFQ